MTDKWKAFPRLAAHFTGRWQTIRHRKWRLTEERCKKSRTKLYMWLGWVCVCVCESISKIIHFTVATHFSLPRPIMGLSGEGDRAGCAGARGRFCLICHQRPGDPHPLSCPLPTHSSIFLPIHGRTSVQLNGSRTKEEGRKETRGPLNLLIQKLVQIKEDRKGNLLQLFFFFF